jgi:hypothetical protein
VAVAEVVPVGVVVVGVVVVGVVVVGTVVAVTDVVAPYPAEPFDQSSALAVVGMASRAVVTRAPAPAWIRRIDRRPER